MHPKQIKALLRRPDMLLTGRVPRMIVPDSPLIKLLECISPRDRVHLRSVCVHPNLGYSSGASFQNAEQMLRWLKPSNRMLENESWPAESHRIKRFSKQLSFDDLLPYIGDCPDSILERYSKEKPDSES